MPHIWASFCRRDGQPDFLAASSNSVNEASDGILELLGTQTATLTLQNAQVPGNGISSLGAAYSGDIHYMASNSGVTNIQTSAAATTVQLTSPSTSVAAGSQVTFSAVVQSGTNVQSTLVGVGSVTRPQTGLW